MEILVGYKRVADYNVHAQVKPDGSGAVTGGVKVCANPFDDIALDDALRLRKKGAAYARAKCSSVEPARSSSRNCPWPSAIFSPIQQLTCKKDSGIIVAIN